MNKYKVVPAENTFNKQKIMDDNTTSKKYSTLHQRCLLAELLITAVVSVHAHRLTHHTVLEHGILTIINVNYLAQNNFERYTHIIEKQTQPIERHIHAI